MWKNFFAIHYLDRYSFQMIHAWKNIWYYRFACNFSTRWFFWRLMSIQRDCQSCGKREKRLAVAFLSLTQKWQFWGKKCWLNDFKVVLKRTWVHRQIKLEEPALVRLNRRDIILKRTYLGWVVFVSWRQLGPSNLSAEVLILMIS